MHVARWYCPTGQVTFSLLPDCLASRLPGSLDEVEAVVATIEEQVKKGVSIETAAGELRPDIELPSAVRWVRRRLNPVRSVLLAVVTLIPGRFGTEASLLGVRRALGTEHALIAIRAMASARLGKLAPPLGFGPRVHPRSRRQKRIQQAAGPDPPCQGR